MRVSDLQRSRTSHDRSRRTVVVLKVCVAMLVRTHTRMADSNDDNTQLVPNIDHWNSYMT